MRVVVIGALDAHVSALVSVAEQVVHFQSLAEVTNSFLDQSRPNLLVMDSSHGKALSDNTVLVENLEAIGTKVVLVAEPHIVRGLYKVLPRHVLYAQRLDDPSHVSLQVKKWGQGDFSYNAPTMSPRRSALL